MSTRPIVDAVLGTRPEPPRRHLLWAAVAGVGAHAMLLGLMWRTGPSLETWAADVAIRVHQELVRVEAVDLEAEAPEPAPPPEQPEPEPEPPLPDAQPQPTSEPDPAKPPPSPDPSPRTPAPRAEPPPAAAAEPLATEPEGPVDLSDDVIVRGSARAYAGGSTTAAGTSRRPVTGPVATSPLAPQGPAPSTSSTSSTSSGPDTRRRDRSAPARPRDADWECPWPRAANALEIDKESATVRAQIDARGRVQSVQIVDDPGHGFGAAAAECARRSRFVPARDADGRRIPSRTPPIRVRFTR